MRRFIHLILFLAALTPAQAQAEDIIKKGELLNLRRCMEISLVRHPNISAARGAVDANESRVGQAASNYYPQVSASAGYSRVSNSFNNNGSRSIGGAGSSDRNFDQYTAGITLSQNVFDFGRTSTQVDIQNLNLESSRSDLVTTEDQLLFNVKRAYYGVLQAKRNRVVAEEAVRQFQLHLEQAKGFYEVGTKPKFDVTKAEVDLSNAKLNLIRAENSLRLSVVTLNNAMGVPEAPEYILEDNLSFEKYDIAFTAALDRAYAGRPDLKSLEALKKASERSINLAKKGYYPVLTGNASYNRSGENFPLDEGWSVGAALTIPIFNGFLTKKQVEEAKANLDVISANEEALRQGVFLEVQQAYLNLIEAGDRIVTAELTVQQATENFEIATGRYGAGVGNPIEVADAEVGLSNAKTAHIQALYDYKVARASLERAMGIR